jgi:hypothetical protein
MVDETQASRGGDEPPLSPAGHAGFAAGEGQPATAEREATAGAAPEAPSPQQGLLLWLAIIAAGGLLSVLLGHAEAALLFAGAGLFALAQATDAAAALAGYRQWVDEQFPTGSVPGQLFRFVVSAIVPIAGALTYVGLGVYSWKQGADLPHRLAAIWSFGAALLSLALAARPVADRVTALMFRGGAVGRTRRLAARFVVLGLLLPVPVRVMFPEMLATLRESAAPIADTGALVSQLLGELAVALAGVGWLVRRRWPETLERLGLVAVRPAHVGVIAAGLAGAIAINGGMEWLQHVAFPELWRQDQEVTRLIAGQMPVWTTLLLGLSAGFGEELSLRGALQPRLGIVLTSVFFACGHVQYSWWGMLTIALLGVLLGLVRRRANTTTAIVVHGLYDIFAVLTSS